MAKQNTHLIGEGIQQLLRSYHLKSKFDETTVVTSWEKTRGQIHCQTNQKISVRNKVLFVSSIPCDENDLNYHKSQIIALFEKEFGKDVIKEIIIMKDEETYRQSEATSRLLHSHLLFSL